MAYRCYSVVTEDTLCLQQALASSGASIREIKVLFNASFDLVDTLPIINITNCTSIRSINFSAIWLSPNFAYTNWLFILPILAQVSSPSFEELCLHFMGVDSHSNDKWNDYLDWKGVAECLLRPQFANLKRVCIEWPLSHDTQSSDVELFFEAGPFSPITRRGLVQLKCLGLGEGYKHLK